MELDRPPLDGSGFSLRLTFGYRGQSLELLSLARIEMVAPPSEGDTEAAEFRVELRDAANRTLFSRQLRNHLSPEREIFPDDPLDPIVRVHVDEPTGAFQVIVPDMEGVADLVLELAADESAGASEATRDAAQGSSRIEVARIDLRASAENLSSSRGRT